MLTTKDVQGVMAMMPAFSNDEAGDLSAVSTVAVDKLQSGVDRMINDGVDIITTTGSFGECYNLFWDEFKTIASATVEAAKKRVPVFIGSTSPNPREVVQRLKFVQDVGGDGTLLGVPYYDAQSPASQRNGTCFQLPIHSRSKFRHPSTRQASFQSYLR